MRYALILIFCTSILLPASALGALLTMQLSYEYSGALPPVGSVPWLTAAFDDTQGPVILTLTATNLTDDEYVAKWLFNLDPDLNPGLLQFVQSDKSGSFEDPTIGNEYDDFNADGDGQFDIEFAFATADGGDNRFGVAEWVEYTITSTQTLTADSFDFQSTPAGGEGTWPTAAHVQAIIDPNNGSGWVTVPEPGALALLVLGALALVRRNR